MNSVEKKIINILFKDAIIADVMVDTLLPERFWSSEAREDFGPEHGFNVARDELKKNLKIALEK
jgi:hypothetical protein